MATALMAAAISGCGGGGGGGGAMNSASSSGDANIVAYNPDTTTSTPGYLPDGTPLTADTPAVTRQTLRVVGDAGCAASRAFSRADIINSGSVFITFTLSGCTVPLESVYFGEDMPAGLIVTPISVKINGAPAAYTYEPATATSTFNHWVLDDVPVDGTAELPAGQTLQVIYRLDEDGTHFPGHVFTFPLFVWSGHNPGSSANVWGYSNAPANLPVAPPPPGPSGGIDLNPVTYNNSKAFDGIYTSWWAGTPSMTRWDLYYGFPAPQQMDYLHINFYDPTYVPTNVNIYYSPDGYNWTFAGAMPAGADKPTMLINATVMYLWIKMSGTPPVTYPLIRDVDWTPVTESSAATGGLGNGGLGEGPSSNLNMYWPSNAFDNNAATWWVGALGNNAWDIYYHFTASQLLSTITINWFSVNHQPPGTVLKYSDDGVVWNSIATTFPPGAASPLPVGRKAKYVKFEMTGAPVTNFPLIKDISFVTPLGPTGGQSNPFFLPPKAFDADTNTFWRGVANDGAWGLFYGYAAPHLFTNVKVQYLGATFVPTSVEIWYSNDGLNWTDAGAMGPAVADPVMPPYPGAVSSTFALNQTARYIAFEMNGNPAATYPVVLEITQ